MPTSDPDPAAPPPGGGSYAEVSERLDRTLADPHAADLVAKFYNPVEPFAGATFDALQPNLRTSFDEVDLLAITLLDVSVKPLALRALLFERRSDTSGYLERIPADLDLWEADEAALAAANDAWEFLDGLPGVGPVIAGKLLARK